MDVIEPPCRELDSTGFVEHPDYSCCSIKMKPFGKSFYEEATNYLPVTWEKITTLAIRGCPKNASPAWTGRRVPAHTALVAYSERWLKSIELVIASTFNFKLKGPWATWSNRGAPSGLPGILAKPTTVATLLVPGDSL